MHPPSSYDSKAYGIHSAETNPGISESERSKAQDLQRLAHAEFKVEQLKSSIDVLSYNSPSAPTLALAIATLNASKTEQALIARGLKMKGEAEKYRSASACMERLEEGEVVTEAWLHRMEQRLNESKAQFDEYIVLWEKLQTMLENIERLWMRRNEQLHLLNGGVTL